MSKSPKKGRGPKTRFFATFGVSEAKKCQISEVGPGEITSGAGSPTPFQNEKGVLGHMKMYSFRSCAINILFSIQP